MGREQIDEFMSAVAALESGGASDPYTVANQRTGAHGRWQIMPDNWAPWSRETFGRVVSRTPENQRAVARNKFLEYYDRFNDWDAVAVAWFAGPGRAQRYQQGDSSVLTMSDGNTRVSEYIDIVNQNMGQSAGPSHRHGQGGEPAPPGGPDALPTGHDHPGTPGRHTQPRRQAYNPRQWDELPQASPGDNNMFDGALMRARQGELNPQEDSQSRTSQVRDRLVNMFRGMADQQAGGRHVSAEEARAGVRPDEDVFSGQDYMRSMRSIDDRIDMASSAVSELLRQGDSTTEGMRAAAGAGRQAAMRIVQNAASMDGDLGVPDTAHLDVDTRPLAISESYDAGRALLDVASQYKGVPYKWGGTNPDRGLDCSGLVQLAASQVGIDLPRVSRDQARQGVEVASLDQAQPGDLVAFSSRGLDVGHIGIYAGGGKMLHAPRSGRNVTIESIGDRRPATIRRVT